MKIQFDTSVHIAGIGMVPWTRLGPERWFPNYKIISLYGWDLHDVPGAPEVIALAENEDAMPVLRRVNTQNLVNAPSFQALIDSHLPGYDFITYRPVNVPEALSNGGHHFLSMDQTLTETFENKAEFRTRFNDLGLPFPHYKIVERSSITADKKTLDTLLAGRPRIIVQDEMISGGRGTFKVSTVEELQYALTSIEALGGGKRLVISDLIENAFERSVQCVVTRYGTFVGHLQKQIIANELLANLEVADGDRFCGGEISAGDPLRSKHAEVKSYALRIGERLESLGYRGIFSVDCLVDQHGKVFLLEVNPRLTGMTPLVTALYREGKDIPFYLLHMLEVAGMEYTITDDYVADEPPEGSLLVVHSHKNTPVHIVKSPASGLYDVTSGMFISKDYRIKPGDHTKHLLVQQYTPPKFKIKPGGRLMSILANGTVTDNNDRLLPDIAKTIQTLSDNVSTKEITK